jgi:hypothetical protein
MLQFPNKYWIAHNNYIFHDILYIKGLEKVMDSAIVNASLEAPWLI